MHAFLSFLLPFPGARLPREAFFQQKTASRICEAGSTNESVCQAAQRKPREERLAQENIRMLLFSMARSSLPAP